MTYNTAGAKANAVNPDPVKEIASRNSLMTSRYGQDVR